MNPWRLVDGRKPLDEGEEHPQIVIRTESQLRDELNQLRIRAPAVVGLISPANGHLDISIGGPFAGVRWIPTPGERSLNGDRVAVASQHHSPAPVDFLAEGVPTTLDVNELLPVEEVIDTAMHFYQTQRLPDWLAWSSWNPRTNRWELIPSTALASV